MKTFVILYVLMAGQSAFPQKVAWFESFDKCVEVKNYAAAHQDGWTLRYTCVEYPDQADGWYK